MASLDETRAFLRREHPEEVEAGELRRAIELSLLDSALMLRMSTGRHGGDQDQETPERVLGVAEGASKADIRAAYRQKARVLHPDKGGDPNAFLKVQRAYRELVKGEDRNIRPLSFS